MWPSSSVRRVRFPSASARPSRRPWPCSGHGRPAAARPAHRRCAGRPAPGRGRRAAGPRPASRRSSADAARARAAGGARPGRRRRTRFSHALPRAGTALRPVHQRDRRRGAHQPRPSGPVCRPRSRRWPPPPDRPTSSSTWPPAGVAAEVAAALAALAAAVPAAEAVHVVNNGAAALGLVAGVLASGSRVVIARGELVEIGDGFRIPELRRVVRRRGCARSVRRTACGSRTTRGLRTDSVGFVLKVHPSNFRVEGFTSSVGVAELAEPAGAGRRRHRVGAAAPAPATAGRARRNHRPARRCGSGDLVRRQAARRPAVRPGAGSRRPRRAAAPAPDGARAARGQADPGRARGDADGRPDAHRAGAGHHPSRTAGPGSARGGRDRTGRRGRGVRRPGGRRWRAGARAARAPLWPCPPSWPKPADRRCAGGRQGARRPTAARPARRTSRGRSPPGRAVRATTS